MTTDNCLFHGSRDCPAARELETLDYKEFEEIIGSTEIDSTWTMKDRLWFIWQAARKDHYRIGEEVENVITGERAEVRAVLDFSGSITQINPKNVRRIPAKSRIDEIAEEAARNYAATSADPRPLKEIIKSAMLRALKEIQE